MPVAYFQPGQRLMTRSSRTTEPPSCNPLGGDWARDVSALKRSIAGGVREVLDHGVRYQRERRSRACPGLPGRPSGLEALQVLQKARVRRLPAERLLGVGTGRGLVGREDRTEWAAGLLWHRLDWQPHPPAAD